MPITLQLTAAEFGIADVTIASMADDYLPLVVMDIHDTEGFGAVHEARMTVRNARTAIEKKRKELKQDSLEYGRAVDAEAKRLTALLEPIEEHLQREEDRVTKAKEKLRQQQEERRQAIIRERLEALAACGVVALATDIQGMDDTDFGCYLSACQAEKKARDDVEAAAAEERRNEEERLVKERVELDRQRQAQEAAAAEERAILERQRLGQEAAQAKIDAQNKLIAAQQAEQQRQQELEQAKLEAAEKARLDTIAEQQRQEAALKAKAEFEAAERRRIESLRPDHEKLLSVADAVLSIAIPTVSQKATETAVVIERILSECASRIRAAANILTK